MKPIFFSCLITVLVLSACSSGKSTFERGNYYEAVITSVNRLRKNDDHKKSVETLRQAYPLAVSFYEDRAKTSLASSELFKWTQVVNAYTTINNMYDEIRRCPGALRVVPNPVNYFSKLQEARQNAAEEHYAAGISALQFNEREKAKVAYGHFKTANEYVPGYKEVISYMEAALNAATVKILVEPIPFHSKAVGVSAAFFNDKISEFVHAAPINEFVRFYTRKEAETIKLKPDHIIQLQFDDFTVGQIYKHEKEIQLTKDSVVMGSYVTPGTVSQPANDGGNQIGRNGLVVTKGSGITASSKTPVTTNTGPTRTLETDAEKSAREKAEREREAQAENDRAAAERLKAEKAAADKERAAREAAEKALAEKERLEKERIAEAQAEKVRAAQEATEKALADKDQAASEAAEKARIEKGNAERAAAEQAKVEEEKLRAAREQAEKERLAKEAADKLLAEKEQAERAAAEKAKAEEEKLRAAREQAEKERLAKEAADKLLAEKEQAERAAAEKARIEKENADREKAERERVAKETAEKEKAEKEKYADPTIDASDTLNVKDPVTICHLPPGNNTQRRTLVISRSALKAHLGHGDIEGDCAGEKKEQKDLKGKPQNDEKEKPNNSNKGKGPGANHELQKAAPGRYEHASLIVPNQVIIASANTDPDHFLRYLDEQVFAGDTNKVYGTVKATLFHHTKTTTAKGVVSFRIVDARTGALLSSEKMPGEFVWVSEWGYFNGDERALSAEQLKITKLKEQPAPAPQDLFIEFTRPIYNQITTKIQEFYKGY